MLLSMTGFGKASAEAGCKKITVELKSLNSKSMDMSARVPSALRSLEIELRNLVSRSLERGKVDLCVSIESLPGDAESVKLNVAALQDYKAQIIAASETLGVPEPTDWWPLLMRLPDVLVNDANDTVCEEVHDALMAAAAEAVEGLQAHRRAEGVKLEEFFKARIEGIAELLKEIEPYESERVPQIKARLEEGLSKIPVAEYDKGRLEQEMIFYIEKLDVNEERQRLGQHLRYFIETMDGAAGQGKKLGFIAQEMGREINTLGSKSNHAEMQRIVVRMKDILEQIKEQVLNVL